MLIVKELRTHSDECKAICAAEGKAPRLVLLTGTREGDEHGVNHEEDAKNTHSWLMWECYVGRCPHKHIVRLDSIEAAVGEAMGENDEL